MQDLDDRYGHPVFDVIVPICSVCKNAMANKKCKFYGDCPSDYVYGNKYDCTHKDINTEDIWYQKIKDKIKD